ncbi:MAG: ParB N-terminal domain-containing protein [Candidatus Aenigmatarchaeota archaeon]
MKIKENDLPAIKFIPIEKLILHEMDDPERTKRIEMKIRADGFLKNPVMVGKIRHNGNKLLLLDGVHRINALKRLGCRDVLAQVIDYKSKDVKVFTWNHLIKGFDMQDILNSIGNTTVEKIDRKKAEVLLKKKKIVGYFLLKNEDVFMIKCDDDLITRTLKLKDIVDTYKGSWEIYRITRSEISFFLREGNDSTAILFIPPYNKREIVELAFKEIKLPAGVTRHIIPNRVLGLNIDLALLKVDISIKTKNKILKEIIKERIANKRTRFYPESVFVFDE